MPFVTLGPSSHAALTGVSAAQHHTATVAGDLNLADMAERDHVSLQSIAFNQHRANATQAEIEAESGSTDVVTPERLRFHPGIAKGWAHITIAGVLSTPSYNVASVTDTGVGDRTVVWDDDFSTAIYAVVVTSATDSDRDISSYADSLLGASVHLHNRQSDDGAGNHQVGALVDVINTIVAFGDQ